MSKNQFSSLEIDAIGEILNISLGASATAVSTMLSRRVDITTPKVAVVSKDEFEFGEIEPAIGVEITYVSGLSGSNIMLLKRHDVKVICEILMGTEIPDEEFELNEMNLSAVCEVMNQMMGASSTALSEFLGEVVNISTPKSFETPDLASFKDKYFEKDEVKVVVYFKLKIENSIESQFMNLMSVSLAKRLLAAFNLGLENEDYEEASAEPETPAEPATASGGGTLSQEEIEKLKGSMSEDTAPEPEPAAASGGTLSQEEIEKLISGQTAEQPAQDAQPQNTQPQNTQPQNAQPQNAQPQNAQPQNAQPQNAQPQMGMYGMPPMPNEQGMPNGMPPMGMYPYGMYPPYPYGMYPPYGMPGYGEEPAQKSKEPREPKVINVNPIQTPNYEEDKTVAGEEYQENLSLIMDVPLEVSVEIGRTKKSVKDILELTDGSLVVLDKLAGEQVDIYANGQCIARGDVVVIEDSFGVRITEIVKHADWKIEDFKKD
nr:flagellar motor switch phosphatase FliY [uncultured Anaerotignum sp.]